MLWQMDGLFPNDEKGWSKGSLVLIWNYLKQTVGSPFFARAGPWKRNLPCGAIKLSVYKMVDLLHGKNTLDKLSKQDFISITLVWRHQYTRESWNLFQTDSSNYMFRYQMITCA